MLTVYLWVSGVGKSVPSVGSCSKPTALQYHKSRGIVSILSCPDGTARLQAQTLQDQDASLDGTALSWHGIVAGGTTLMVLLMMSSEWYR